MTDLFLEYAWFCISDALLYEMHRDMWFITALCCGKT